jgi:hypothetical protein
MLAKRRAQSLPAYGRNYEEAASLLSTLKMRGAKSLTRGLVSPKGKTRYVKRKEPTIHPKDAASNSVF